MGTEKHDSSSCWDAASRDWNTSVWVMVVSADCKLCSCAPASCALVPIAVRLAVSVCTRALVSGMEVFCRVVFSVSMPCWSCVRPAVSCCICWRLSAERLPLRLSDRVCKPAVICALPCWSCAAPLVRACCAVFQLAAAAVQGLCAAVGCRNAVGIAADTVGKCTGTVRQCHCAVCQRACAARQLIHAVRQCLRTAVDRCHAVGIGFQTAFQGLCTVYESKGSCPTKASDYR